MCVLPDHAGAEQRELGGVGRMESEHAVQFLDEAFIPSGQLYQPFDVMLYRPEILPAVALADVGRIVFGIEIGDEPAFRVARLHEGSGRIVHVAVIL